MTKTVSIIASSTGGSNFAPAPEGLHVARCISMIDMGTHEENGQFGLKRQHKIRLGFELPEELAVFKEENGEQPYIVSQDFTLSLHEKAKLRAFLEGWRAKKFTDEQAQAFDVAVLLGKPCFLNIIHATGKNGRTYANIASASKLPKNQQAPPQVSKSVIFSLADFDQSVFDSLPEWMQKRISESDEFVALANKEEPQGAKSNDAEEEDQIPF